MVKFERVAIVGVGLLGASLGMALRRRGLATRVVGIGRAGSESLKVALERGAIDEGVVSVEEGVRGCDLLVLCTPVGTFAGLMEKLAGSLAPGAVVTDVGSSKQAVMGWAEQKLAGKMFVGSHPMAGSEKNGPRAARDDLFEGGMCLMVEGANAKCEMRNAKEKLEGMWKGVGMRVVWMGAREHDEVVGVISHLPHAVAFALASAVGRRPESFVAAGGGYGDTTRIAGSDVTMWRDVFLTNREAVVGALGEFEAELAGLKAAIAAGDAGEIERRLTAGRRAREAVLAAKSARGG